VSYQCLRLAERNTIQVYHMQHAGCCRNYSLVASILRDTHVCLSVDPYIYDSYLYDSSTDFKKTYAFFLKLDFHYHVQMIHSELS